MSQTSREVDTSALEHPGLGKLERKIRSKVGRAICDFNMIEAGDRIMVCLSGGADSYSLLDMLLALQKAAPIDFELVAVNLDQKQPGFPEQVLPDYLASLGVEFRIVEEDTYSLVKRLVPVGKTTCSLCSRLRRGVLYNAAAEFGATKIALGHHADDIVETLFLNMFFNSRLKAMPAKLRSDDQRHIVIRPLAYVREALIKQYAALRDFPIIPCNLCGSQPGSQRQAVKRMLQQWDEVYPGRVDNIVNSLGKVTASHLLDRELFDFHQLAPGTD
ncbi:MAG: tRNA 2-thiocytidine(32) synthetase TtcA [Gammaproteobacteria bacterium]|nr:tRNA 2-thiocytidine(32) synthetase TtcA [Gammaproteobacteria bacterium]MDH3856876.1 tRNA 2-thiocytidine(32) synthetase TtcA [Gammaproteobacteria bacterium]